MRQFNSISLCMLVGLSLTALLSACATSPTGRSQFLLISPEEAIVQSQPAYFSFVQQSHAANKLLDDPMLANRVAVVTGRVVAETIRLFPHTRYWNWSVALIDEPRTVNAWCMAGGRMAVYSGLFRKLYLTDDELAQIMGHEISHAVANHTAERMSMALAQNLGLGIMSASGAQNQTLQATQLAALLAVNLPNSRDTEYEADLIGIELAAGAGYEPAAAVTLWDKMERESGSTMPQFLATHPSPANRRANLAAWVPHMIPLMPARPPSPHPVTVLP